MVNPLPVAVITGDHIICLGLSDTLFASGAGVNGTYLWSTGATTTSIIVTPTQNTTYSVTVTSSAMCTDAESFAVQVNTDNDPIALCKDITVNLNASGEATITPAMVVVATAPKPGNKMPNLPFGFSTLILFADLLIFYNL